MLMAILQEEDKTTIYDLIGLEGVMEFFELVLMCIIVTFYLYHGLIFFMRFRNKELYEVERKLNLGYGFFFIGLTFGYGLFVADRIGRYFRGGKRFFLTSEDYFGTEYTSAFNRDYILFTFIGLGMAFVFLSFVVEKYMLNRKRLIITYLCLSGWVFTIILRPLEVYVIFPHVPVLIEYLGYISYLILLIVYVLLFIIYVTIARNAPLRSDLWKRSVAFIVGLTTMMIFLIGLSNVFTKASPEDWFYFPGVNLTGPICILISLFIMKYGFSKGK
ncbi:MAG: hypothetical protein ACTSRA_02780 [Promethearchaeota archaeon]